MPAGVGVEMKKGRGVREQGKGTGLSLEDDSLGGLLILLRDRKAEEIQVYDVAKRLPIADFFVVATGTSGRHLEALAAEVRDWARSSERRKRHGSGETGWILFDLGNIVLHLFTAEIRRYYRLDAFWRDCEVTERYCSILSEAANGNGKEEAGEKEEGEARREEGRSGRGGKEQG
ncbi:MAG: ribosome silencing factor [Candidatus Hydrogenedentota bacterium]|nr:MAG: ribosome silencing factor [Candidatus Hydrogenedentota bacterium]